MISESTLGDRVAQLRARGPRLSGSPAHLELIEAVAAEWASLGLEVRRDTHTFTRWDVPRTADHLRLSIAGIDVEISSAYPYSGTTGSSGATGRLHLLHGLRPRWAQATGGIAVVAVAHPALPHDLLLGEWEPGENPPIANPVFSATLLRPDLDAARKAGVLGVILIWQGLSSAQADGQYLPFTEDEHHLPAVWVAGEAGKSVRDAARTGKTAMLVLDATRTPGTEMDTIWTVCEPADGAAGRPDEAILVVSHSDGTNAVEENGHLALLELARQVVARRGRRRVVFVLVAGHLRIPAVSAHGQATSAWLEAHRDTWAGEPGGSRAVAGLVVEHLGAREFYETDDGVMAPTGRDETELLYATTRPLRDLAVTTWVGVGSEPVIVRAPGPLVHFGEGEPLFERRIPGVALVSGPSYLLAERDGDLVDVELMSRQIDAFAQLLRRIDDLEDATSLGAVRTPRRWRRAMAAGRAALLIARIRRST